jgi:hypothetical protein
MEIYLVVQLGNKRKLMQKIRIDYWNILLYFYQKYRK